MSNLIKENDLMGVLMALKYNTFRDLKVATLGTVVSIGDRVLVKPFPLITDETDKNITCHKLSGLELIENDIVLVIFTDRNFLQNLSQLKNNQKLSKLTENDTLHVDKYGIIVGKVE